MYLCFFSFCKRQIWLELARETQNSNCLIFLMHRWLTLDLEPPVLSLEHDMNRDFLKKIMHFALMIGPSAGAGTNEFGEQENVCIIISVGSQLSNSFNCPGWPWGGGEGRFRAKRSKKTIFG